MARSKRALIVSSLVALLALVAGCDLVEQRNPPAEEWAAIEARGWADGPGFSLRLPPGWKLKELRGIDSYVGEIVGPGVRLLFDYGWPSNQLPYENDPDHTVTHEEIGGRRAKLVQPVEGKKGVTGAYFEDFQPTLRQPGSMPIALTIVGIDLRPKEQDIAFAIYRTVRSLPPRSPEATQGAHPTPILAPIVCSPQAKELPCGAGAEVGMPYPYQLYTHCGIRWAYFNGRWWQATPRLDDGSGNPPRGWGNPYDVGTMELASGSLARFTSGAGQTAEFKPLPVEVQEFPGQVCS